MIVVRVLRTTAALGLIALLNSACSTVSEAVSDATPYGVQLRQRVEQWDRWCKGEKLGPYNTDPRRAHIGTCDFLYLKDQRWDPNADEFSRYAHSIKLPPPHDQPQAQYRPGMTSKQYFEELCAKEAGQWIFRTVTGVEGVLQARPRSPQPRGRNQLVPHASEVLLGNSDSDEIWIEQGGKGVSTKFTFLEYPAPTPLSQSAVARYYRSIDDARRLERSGDIRVRNYLGLYDVPFVLSVVPRATHAFVGRGIWRSEFADHGVSGTELIVFDRQSLEVLGLARRFYLVRPAPLPVGQLNQEAVHAGCRDPLGFISAMTFVSKVLIPSPSR